MNTNQTKGIENSKHATLVFDNNVTMSRTTKDIQRNEVRIISELDLSSDLMDVTGFSLALYSKANIMSCEITEEELKQMLEYVQKHKNAKYDTKIEGFVYPSSNEVKN